MLNYFYFSNINSPKNASIVLTFLHQLLSRMPLGYNIIEERYDKWVAQGLYPECIQLDELWALFRAATKPFKRLYMVIDGVDQFEPQERWDLHVTIDRLFKGLKLEFKVLISSRDFPEINRLGRYRQLKIQPSDTEDDIRKFVYLKVESNELFARSGLDLSPDTKQYICHSLIKRAQGM